MDSVLYTLFAEVSRRKWELHSDSHYLANQDFFVVVVFWLFGVFWFVDFVLEVFFFSFAIATVMTQNIKIILILEIIFNRSNGANNTMGL